MSLKLIKEFTEITNQRALVFLSIHMITKFCANPEQNQESRLNVWTLQFTVGKQKFSVLLLTTFLLSTVIHQVNIQTGQQMLGLICSLQRDKPGRQLGKSVVVLKMKI